MAFSADVMLVGYKVLGVTSGVSKQGKPWKQLNLFKDARTIECSTTDVALFGVLDSLRELEEVDVPARAVAGKERSYIVITGEPVRVGVASADALGS